MIEDEADHLALLDRELIHRFVEAHPVIVVGNVGRDRFVGPRVRPRNRPGRAGPSASPCAAARGRCSSRRMWTAARLKKSRGVRGSRRRSVRSNRITLFCSTSSVSATPRTFGKPRIIRADELLQPVLNRAHQIVRPRRARRRHPVEIRLENDGVERGIGHGRDPRDEERGACHPSPRQNNFQAREPGIDSKRNAAGPECPGRPCVGFRLDCGE